MGMESDLKFEDIFQLECLPEQSMKSAFDYELDLILGLSPLPMSMQESMTEQKIGEVDLVRKNSLKSQSLETNHNQGQQESRNTEDSSNTKTSNHHNFQKHTVTALRDLVKEENFQSLCLDSRILKLTVKLWREFLKIKGKSIMTKKFLSILFRSDFNSVQLLKPYGFKDMLANYSQSEILESKNELRRLVIIFLNQQNIQDHVQKRQLKRKEEFRLYLINFRRDLEGANIKKRISKQSSDWISDNAKIFDCLN